MLDVFMRRQIRENDILIGTQKPAAP